MQWLVSACLQPFTKHGWSSCTLRGDQEESAPEPLSHPFRHLTSIHSFIIALRAPPTGGNPVRG